MKSEIIGSRLKVSEATSAWNKAPSHVKAMAGEVMRPLFIAMLAQQAALEAIEKAVTHG